MDKKAIEQAAVGAVKNSIGVCDFLSAFIADNDKEPSWDGHIYIYKNKNKKKEEIKGRVAVQIKGTENNDFSKSEISFPVSLSDLNNYLNNGGAVFFVVYIKLEDEELSKQIYYATLSPIEIRVLLFEASNQKNKSITLKKFPKNSNEKTMILLNFFENCQKQSSFSTAKLFSLEELENQGVLESISIPISTIGNISPKTALLTNKIYLYANIKGGAIAQPLEIIPQKVITFEERPVQITIGDKCFYNKVKIYRQIDKVTITLGESFSMITTCKGDSITIEYKSSNKIRTLAIDLDFMLTCISQGGFQYNGINIPLDITAIDFSKFSVEKGSKLLEYIKKIVCMLDLFSCKEDIDINVLKEQHIKNIDCLVTAIVDKKEVTDLRENLPPILTLPIGNLNFLIFLQKKENAYQIFDFFNTEVVMTYKSEDGKDLLTSQYDILCADDILKLNNIRFDLLLPSFQKVIQNRETIIRANFFLLDLLEAYDRSNNRVEIITTAQDFSDWIMTASEDELPYDIRILNKLQVIKRQRTLDDKEKEELFRIIESSNSKEEILIGAYLLLDQQNMAKSHFEKLDKQFQEEFKKYPIYHFWKDDNNE